MFTILLAGCAHDGQACEPLSAVQTADRDLAACEARLDRELMAQTAEWPVFQGQCVSSDQMAAGEVPAWWTLPGTVATR